MATEGTREWAFDQVVAGKRVTRPPYHNLCLALAWFYRGKLALDTLLELDDLTATDWVVAE